MSNILVINGLNDRDNGQHATGTHGGNEDDMTEDVFRWTVVMLLLIILSGLWVTAGSIGTIMGTTEYLAMKARERSAHLP